MTPIDPMAVAIDWIDAYRAARINQMIGMYSPDAVIDCACGGNKAISGQEGIADYWRNRSLKALRSNWSIFRWTVRPWWSLTKRTAGLLRHC